MSDFAAFLDTALGDRHTSWAVAALGAAAEFHWLDGDQPTHLDGDSRRGRRTRAGAIAVRTGLGETTVVYERPGADHHRRVHGVAICLPQTRASSHRRPGITNLGPDKAALDPAGTTELLFDLGLGCANLDACVRTAEPALIEQLEQHAGKPLLEAGPDLLGTLLSASPTRVFESVLARIEVYQAIAPEGGETPPGPHTHVLPKLLKTRRTHFPYVPVPEGMLPVLECYPGPAQQYLPPTRHGLPEVPA